MHPIKSTEAFMIKKTLFWLYRCIAWLHRFAWILAAILAVILLLIYLGLRFAFLPNIHQYKDTIAAEVSKVAKQKVTIGNISADWDTLSPLLSLKNVTVFDAQNRPALQFDNIDTALSWLSVTSLEPRLANITIYAPKLTVRREANGEIFIAGISVNGPSKPELGNWLLKQGEINIQNASVTWQDDFRHAPPLSLDKLAFRLERPALKRLLNEHQFSLQAMPSIGTSSPIAINGNFYGNDVSKMQDWHGNIHVNLKNADLSVWKQWLDYPINIQEGTGTTQTSLHFAHNQVDKITSDVALKEVSVKLKQTDKIIKVNALSGNLTLDTQGLSAQELALQSLIEESLNKKSGYAIFEAKNLKLATGNGLNINNGYARYKHKADGTSISSEGTLMLDQVRLESLRELILYTPIPQDKLDLLKKVDPSGTLKDFKLSWSGSKTQAKKFKLSTAFSGLAIQPYEKIPGFTNLTGNITANENEGTLELDSRNASLNFQQVLRWPVPADKLTGEVKWQDFQDKPTITANNLSISNTHIAGSINATYQMNGIKGGYLDLSGKFDNGNAKFARFYYPIILGESTLHWLDTSILAGKANDVNLTVKGNLADFPYVNQQNKLDPKLGTFRVTAKISDAQLEYGTDWPIIEGLGLDMLFEGKRMELNANKGHIFGNKIIKSKTEIPQLDADSPMLLITSEVEGTVVDGVKFVNESPVKQVALGFTDDLKTAGNGKLHLELKIPMQDLEAAKYKGAYTISNGSIFANADIGLPELSKINGVLNFTESNLSAQNVNTEILGGPAKLSLVTGADKIIHINAGGRINDTGIKKIASNPFTDALQGSTDWSGNITIKKPLVDLNIRSNLVGMAIQLPAPLGKTPAQQALLTINKKQLSPSEDTMDIAYGNVISAKMLRNGKDSKLAFDRGDIGINMLAERPADAGLSIHGKLDYVNVDEWLALFNKPSDKATMKINKADLSVQKLDFFNRRLNALRVVAKPNSSGLQLNIDSQEVTGAVEWQEAKSGADSGKVIARLKNLTIPSSSETNLGSAKKDIKRQNSKYPALDITAENFQLGNKKLGALELNAFASNEDWIIQKLKISNPDTTLLADGSWHNWTRNPNTNLKFALSVENIGKALKRFGQPDVVKGGTAAISGQLQWPGSPHEFETNGLSGNFILGASKGQVLKVQPGVGRLLGLLSLQSLPRRLSLDFRDLFSDGFAFDSISATAKIDNGIMRSDDFFMTGPAAEAQIKGETNLQKETQNLKVKVIPHISDSLSLAALAGGPIVGAAAFVAQKILKDPFNKIVQSEYVITGTWDNPQEVKSEQDEPKPNNQSPLGR